MTVAIIQTGGKQYLVHEGQELAVERLNTEADSALEFADLLNGKKVQAKLVNQFRKDKVSVVKFKAKVRYLRRAGHRQHQSRIRIESIK